MRPAELRAQPQTSPIRRPEARAKRAAAWRPTRPSNSAVPAAHHGWLVHVSRRVRGRLSARLAPSHLHVTAFCYFLDAPVHSPPFLPLSLPLPRVPRQYSTLSPKKLQNYSIPTGLPGLQFCSPKFQRRSRSIRRELHSARRDRTRIRAMTPASPFRP